MSETPEPTTDAAPEVPPVRPAPLLKLAVFAAVFVGTLWALKAAGVIQGGPVVRAGKSTSPLEPGTVEVDENGNPVIHLVPRYGEIPAFSLLEAEGREVSREDLKGKVWVASFLFTHCASTCPAMADRNRILQGTLPEGALLVSVSVDPTRDTPEVLAEWGKLHQRDPERWWLLTGEWEKISELATKGFYLGGDEPLLHSTRFALVDQVGALRGYYDSREEPQMAKLVRDVNLVLAEDSL